MKLKSFILFSAFMLTGCLSFADVSVPYGEGTGKVDYISNSRYPRRTDPMPFGPLSFRIVEDKVWVVDSVGGKLMQFNNKDGKQISEFSILPEGIKSGYTEEKYIDPATKKEYCSPVLNILIDDFAPVYGKDGKLEAWWLADSCNNKLVKYSVEGKKLGEFTHSDFIQVSKVEVGAGGHIFVADEGANYIFVFDENGNFIRKWSDAWTGLAVSGDDEKLYRLVYDREKLNYNIVAAGLDGKIIMVYPISNDKMPNATLWWVNEAKSECLITYCPKAGGFKGTYEVARIGFDGEIKAHAVLNAPFVMNRFIDNLNFDEIYQGQANFDEAPEGSLKIIPFKFQK